MGTRARVRAHCPEVAVPRTLDRCYPLKEAGRIPWMLLRWAVLEVVLPVRLVGCDLVLVESMQRCESSSAWHPPRRSTEQRPGRLSLCCRCRVDGWVQRQGSDARQASGTSTALAERAARAGGGGGRFPEAPWTPCSQGVSSVGVASPGPLCLGTYPGVRSDRTLGWCLAGVRGRGWRSSRGTAGMRVCLASLPSLTFFQLHRWLQLS